MLHLWTGLLQVPAEVEFDVLHQVTGQLYVSNISRVLEGSKIVVLQDAGRVEVVYEAFTTVSSSPIPRRQSATIEMPRDLLNGIVERRCGDPSTARLGEAPKIHYDDL